MADRIGDAVRFHQTALNLRAQRSELLAANIANADTPNYKARDIDFRAALAAAVGPKAGAVALAKTSPQHLPAAGAAAAGGPLLYRAELQSRADGNTVDLDVERAQFSQNAVHYEASITFLGSVMRTLQTAITGQ